MQDTMAHKIQLTQESWGMTSALQYDVSNVLIHLGLDYQQSQPYQQENNDDEEENNDDEGNNDGDDDPNEGEQDFDEED